MSRAKCTIEEHHKNPAVGSSGLRTLIDRSPAHFLYERENPSESTPSQLFGQAIHQAILEPELFNFMVEPKFEGTGSRAAREKWHLENHGKTILKQEQLDAIVGIKKSISAHKWASKVIAGGGAEESFFCRDPETKIDLKARPDYLREDHIIVDIKSTLDASYHNFHRDLANYGYHIQAALYLDVVSQVMGRSYDTFIVVAVEKEPPYAVQCFQIDDSSISEGRALYFQALKTLRTCLDTKIFPAYPQDIVPIALPSWAFKHERL